MATITTSEHRCPANGAEGSTLMTLVTSRCMDSEINVRPGRSERRYRFLVRQTCPPAQVPRSETASCLRLRDVGPRGMRNLARSSGVNAKFYGDLVGGGTVPFARLGQPGELDNDDAAVHCPQVPPAPRRARGTGQRTGPASPGSAPGTPRRPGGSAGCAGDAQLPLRWKCQDQPVQQQERPVSAPPRLPGTGSE